MRLLIALVVFAAASCGSPAAVTVSPSPLPSPVAVLTSGPQFAIPTPSLAPGTCTRPDMTTANLIDRWSELAGKHDRAAVRDCFAASYGVPESIVERWADLGSQSKRTVERVIGAVSNGCERFSVTAEFPNGNPYAPVQSANTMFLVVGVGQDGDRPRIFGTATADIRRSPDVTPHAGPPDCR
jgi:hypothetical protein